MNLIWHIVRKDARRMRLPLAIWLTSIVLVAAWMRFAPTSSDHWPFSDLTMWLEIVGIVTAIIAWAQVVVGAVLAGAIMQEDVAAGTAMFWRTRPISATRLLTAKLAGIGGLVVFAPVVALVPIWLASGFSAGEMIEASWDWVKWQGIAAWLGIIAAAVSENLRQFFFTAVGIGAVVGFTMLRWLPFFTLSDRAPSMVRESRDVAIALLCVVGGLAVLLKAYRAAHVRDARTALGLTAILLLVVRLWYPWTFFGGGWPRPMENLAETVKVEVLPGRPARVGATIPLRVDGSGAAVKVQFVKGSVMLPGGKQEAVGLPEALSMETLRQVVTPPGRVGPIVCDLRVLISDADRRAWQATPARFEGTAGLVVMQPRVLGQCPVEKGASIKQGAATLRVLEIFQAGDASGKPQVFVMIEERDAWPAWREESFLNDVQPPGWKRKSMEDAYVLVASDHKTITRLNVTGGVTIVRHGILRSVFLLEGVPATEWSGSRLVKIRFDKTQHLLRTLRTDLPFETTLSP